MKKIIIYSSSICPYCIAAKNLLNQENLNFKEVLVDGDKNLRKKMIEISSGAVTVPQIFFGKTHIGGYEDLKNIFDKGLLMEYLE